jgi:hypothetical protein
MKILKNYRFYWGVFRGRKSIAEKWAFIRLSLVFRVGSKIKKNK